MITMLATLCHMATVAPGIPAIEFCQETVIARNDGGDQSEDAIASCYVMAQQVIAGRIQPGYTVKQIRCAKGNEAPRGSI